MRVDRWLEALVLLGAAGAAWFFQLGLPRHLPTAADRAAVAKVLAKEARPGDVLLLFPWWTERARVEAPPGLPVVGYLGSNGDDLEMHPRIWVLSQPELPRAERGPFEAQFLPGRRSETPARSFGPLRLEGFLNQRYQPPLISSDDSVPAVGSIAVEQPGKASTGGVQACSSQGGRITCPGGAFVQGPAWHEVRYRPLKCLWIHPPPAPARLVLALPEATLADRARVEVGIFWEHAAKRTPKLSPVKVAIEGATAPASIVLLPGDEGLQRMERPLNPGGGHGLRVTVETDNPESRELCLRWNLYSPPPASGELP